MMVIGQQKMVRLQRLQQRILVNSYSMVGLNIVVAVAGHLLGPAQTAHMSAEAALCKQGRPDVWNRLCFSNALNRGARQKLAGGM